MFTAIALFPLRFFQCKVLSAFVGVLVSAKVLGGFKKAKNCGQDLQR